MPLEVTIPLIMIVIGVLMLLAEAATPGNFLIVPATVLLILGFVGLVAPGILFSWFSPLLAVVVLIPTTILAIRFYQRLAPPAPPETVVASSLVGRTGVVTATVAPNSLKGKVRIEHDDWSATAKTCIPVGTPIRVVASEGVHVTVEEVEGEMAQGLGAPECQ
jgi:membrane protein implicated in regulation of membrane protease activity